MSRHLSIGWVLVLTQAVSEASTCAMSATTTSTPQVNQAYLSSCGPGSPVPAGSVLSASLTRFPGYNGNEVHGTVSLMDVAGVQPGELALSYSLQGLPGGSSTGGIHVHEGTSCDAVQGHYYQPAGGGAVDPWTNSKWSKGGSTSFATGMNTLGTGYNLADNTGHAVVVHDGDPQATMIACGVLASTSSTSSSDSDDGGLAGWQVALIVIGSVLATALLVAGGLWCFVLRKRAIHEEGQGVEDGVIIAEFENPASKQSLGNQTPPSMQVNLQDSDNQMDQIPVYTLPACTANDTKEPSTDILL